MNNVTVAICAYNAAKYIEETLTCIINQTFQKFDLLIVNDCSTDNTRELIIKFFEKHPRPYNLISFDLNRGIAFGRKYVLENVLSKYVIFIDADDKPYPALVEKLFSKIESDSRLMAVGCYLEYIDRNGAKLGGGLFIGKKTPEEFYKKARNRKLIFMQPTAIIHRETALLAGGICIAGYFEGKPRYQDLCEDLDLWTRMSDFYKEGKAIVVIPEVLCQYRKMEHTTSTNTIGMIIKVRYIKSNLLKRRSGQKEETFVEFFNAITPRQMKKLKRDADAAVMLRNGVFALKKRQIFKAIYSIMSSIWLNPKYIIQKLINNAIRS
ncbi:MAG: putative teichuronic acid biosynthesis glycosyltransferase TuaG [Bacteroidetes bacterium ADurb.Bin234]|nr:MAG: putative teichuronic acid biosynthesis glycosyltransferase TuaG [Bacteroidetes bacterium ADurb.Bin234]